MGNAYILYYPENGKTLESIDLGRNLTDLQESPVSDRAAASSVYGSSVVSQYSNLMRVRVTLSRFSGATAAGATLARQLFTLQSHMDRGGTVAVAGNISKAYATYTKSGLTRGTTRIPTTGNVWDFGTSGRDVASGDEVMVQSDNPECRRELRKITLNTPTAMTLTEGLVYDYTRWMMVRHRDFYPVLRFPSDERQLILTSERRLVYTLDMTLEEDPPALAAGGAMLSSGALMGGTASGGKVTLGPDKKIGGVMTTMTRIGKV